MDRFYRQAGCTESFQWEDSNLQALPNTVTHHNKIFSVQTHMKSCKPFVNLMNCTADQDKPEWYKELRSQQKKRLMLLQICLQTISSADFSTPYTIQVCLDQQYNSSNLQRACNSSYVFKPAKLMKSSNINIYGVPKLTNGESRKVESCLAMHYYITGTSILPKNILVVPKLLPPFLQYSTYSKSTQVAPITMAYLYVKGKVR